MTNSELNKYIEHYLEEDKTNRAIMLTGDWGSGKSYYINHELVPYLSTEDKNRCIIVSLYGLKDVSEISKSIYLESRLKFLQTKNESLEASRFVIKTVAKGITSLLGVDIGTSEQDMQRVYNSVDLTDKLLVFEDLERSAIEISEILGYVNNLVEQDGVKVLLVANENEIIEYDMVEDTEEKTPRKILTEKSFGYLKAKEKTISDTICFYGEQFSSVKNIILELFSEQLCLFSKDEKIQDILELFVLSGSNNLRTFIYACQKTSDIFEKLRDDIDYETKETIFYSLIFFSNRIKSGEFPKWEGTNYLSTELGNNMFPLYKFCYDYIRWQEFDDGDLLPTLEEHKKMKLYQKYKNDSDLDIIFNYFTHTEEEVVSALKNVENKLDIPEAISFYHYGKLACYLIACQTILGFDITEIKKKILTNIRENGENIDDSLMFLSFTEFDTDEQKKLFSVFKTEIIDAITEAKQAETKITYEPDDIAGYYNEVVNNKCEIRNNHRYISKMNMNALVSMVFNCSASQLHDFRGVLFAIYRDCRKGDFIEQDAEFMKELKNRIEEEKEIVKDRIILLQLNFLCGNLETFINQIL